MLHPGDPRPQHQGLGLHLQSGGDPRRGRGARCTRAAWTQGAVREAKPQRGRLSQGTVRSLSRPPLDPADADPSDTHTNTRQHPRLLRAHAHQPTLTRAHTRTHKHAHTHAHTHTASPRHATATSSPPAWPCPQLPFRLKLFPRRRQGSRGDCGPARLPGSGRPAPGGSWLPSLPPPGAPHLVNRGTARGCSRPRARSPSRRPHRGTRTASCWLRGGRACAP